jgi:hypothetical protein
VKLLAGHRPEMALMGFVGGIEGFAGKYRISPTELNGVAAVVIGRRSGIG